MDSFRSLNLPITKMTVPPLLFLTPRSNVFSSSSCRPCVFIPCSCDHQTCHFLQLLASKPQERPQALVPTSTRSQSSCFYSRPNLHFLLHAVKPPKRPHGTSYPGVPLQDSPFSKWPLLISQRHCTSDSNFPFGTLVGFKLSVDCLIEIIPLKIVLSS